MLAKETTTTANRIEPMEVAALGGLPDAGKRMYAWLGTRSNGVVLWARQLRQNRSPQPFSCSNYELWKQQVDTDYSSVRRI